MCRKLALTGWLLLIPEDFEKARVLAAILISVVFLSLHLAFKPLRRAEDSLLMTFFELVLLLLYVCVLLIKTCDLQGVQVSATVTSSAVQTTLAAMCRGYGFGDTAGVCFEANEMATPPL